MKKHFYIFRHGQTIWNAEGRPQGQHPYPVPLTMTGREQAAELAAKLADKKIKTLISSDLLRARQTAEIVAEKLGLKVEFDPRLREVDYGELNGMYTLEVFGQTLYFVVMENILPYRNIDEVFDLKVAVFGAFHA